MSAFSFDACCESFAKAQNRFAGRFISEVVPDSLHSRFWIRYVLFFFRFSLLKLTKIIYYCSVLHVNKYYVTMVSQQRRQSPFGLL